MTLTKWIILNQLFVNGHVDKALYAEGQDVELRRDVAEERAEQQVAADVAPNHYECWNSFGSKLNAQCTVRVICIMSVWPGYEEAST